MLSVEQRAAAFDRIADLAPTLGGTEIALLIALTRLCDPSSLTLKIAGRDLAAKAGIGYTQFKLARHNLTARCLITQRAGTTREATGYMLNFLKTASISGSFSGPLPSASGSFSGPQRDLFRPTEGHLSAHSGPFSDPLAAETTGDDHRAGARVDFDSISDSIFDRVLKARPSHHAKNALATCREWLHGYMCKFGQPDSHPPDDLVCAQFLTIESWPVLERLLYDLMAERKDAYSYGWFITVALQRIHGIAPPVQKARRAQLREVKREKASAAAATPAPTQSSLPLDPDEERHRRIAEECRRPGAAAKDFAARDLVKDLAKKITMGARR